MSAANAEQFYQLRPKDEARGHRGQAKSFTNLSKSSIIFHPADSSKGAKVYKFLFEPLSRCGCRLLKVCGKAGETGQMALWMRSNHWVFLSKQENNNICILQMSLAKTQKIYYFSQTCCKKYVLMMVPTWNLKNLSARDIRVTKLHFIIYHLLCSTIDIMLHMKKKTHQKPKMRFCFHRCDEENLVLYTFLDARLKRICWNEA